MRFAILSCAAVVAFGLGTSARGQCAVEFAPTANFNIGGQGPNDLVAAHMNGDQFLDVVTGNDSSGTVSVLLGNGDGTFQNPIVRQNVGQVKGMTGGDFNSDGKADIAVVTPAHAVSILMGNGDGTLQAPVLYAVGSSPHGVEAADFNGDGRPDLVTRNLSANGVSVLLNRGDGTFHAAVHYPVFMNAFGIAAGDLDGDGRLDVVCGAGDHVEVLMGNGAGGFGTPIIYGSIFNTIKFAVVIADVNGDGRNDVVSADLDSGSGGDLSVLLGTGNPHPNMLATPLVYDIGSQPNSVGLLDFNYDAVLDVFVGNAIRVTTRLGTGLPHPNMFAPLVNQNPGAFSPYSAIGADVNQDGLPDLVSAGFSTNSVSVLLNRGRVCPPDFNCDTFANGVDYDQFVQAFEEGDPDADFDRDGFNTGLDFDLYVQAFEVGC